MSVSGVSSHTFAHLPPEEQQQLRAEERASHPATTPTTPAATTPPQQRINPADARSPREAVEAIHSMPLPYVGDLLGMNDLARDSVYEGRARQFNGQRVAAAQASVTQFAPKRADFGTGKMAGDEYRAAVDAYNQDPYVQELNRIIDEGTKQPTKVPSYLTSNQSPSLSANMDVDQMRGILSFVGVDIPVNATPEDISAGYEILSLLPDSMVALAIAPGMQVSFEQPLYGISTPQFVVLPASVGGDTTVTGEVGLSDVSTGVGFQQSQSFEMSVQVQGNANFDFGKSPLQKWYGLIGKADKWAGRANTVGENVSGLGFLRNNVNLSPRAQAILDKSPLPNWVAKGTPLPTVSTSKFGGERLTFEANVTPEQGAKLANGDLSAAPNPLDPLNMPPGTSVMMRGQQLVGTSFEYGWKKFQVSGEVTQLAGQGFGVRKLDGPGQVVEVFTGPIKTLENSAFMGFGKNSSASVGMSTDTTLENQQMSVARIDLGTAEGQQAYQIFMSTGQVPHWNPPGVQAAGKSDIFQGEHAAKFAANLGPLGIEFGNGSQLTVTRTAWEDGTVTQQNTWQQSLDKTSDITTKIGLDGQPIDSETQWTMVMANTDPDRASLFNDAYRLPSKSSHGSFDGPQHIQLQFTADDLLGVKSQARATLPGGSNRLETLDADPSQAATQQERLAVAKTPGDVFHILNQMDPGELAVTLGTLAGQTHKPVPGSLSIKDAG